MAGETNNWLFDVTPYLLIVGADIETSLPSLSAPAASSAGHFETRLSGGAL